MSSRGERGLMLLKLPRNSGKPSWSKSNCFLLGRVKSHPQTLETPKNAYDFQLSNCWDNTVLLTVQDLAASAQKPGRGHPSRDTRSPEGTGSPQLGRTPLLPPRTPTLPAADSHKEAGVRKI